MIQFTHHSCQVQHMDAIDYLKRLLMPSNEHCLVVTYHCKEKLLQGRGLVPLTEWKDHIPEGVEGCMEFNCKSDNMHALLCKDLEMVQPGHRCQLSEGQPYFVWHVLPKISIVFLPNRLTVFKIWLSPPPPLFFLENAKKNFMVGPLWVRQVDTCRVEYQYRKGLVTLPLKTCVRFWTSYPHTGNISPLLWCMLVMCQHANHKPCDTSFEPRS